MRKMTCSRACAAVCCALLGVAGFAGEVEVRSSTLCIKFDEGAKGEVCSALAHGRDYASPVARFPLVELGCCPVANRAKQVLVTTRQAAGFAVERTANGVRLVYRDLGDAVEEVVCTVEAKDEDVLWRLSAKPKPGWGVVETHYPMFALNERLGATPDGRHKGQPTCDSVAALRGKAEKGPMAMLCSAAKLPQNLYLGKLDQGHHHGDDQSQCK